MVVNRGLGIEKKGFSIVELLVTVGVIAAITTLILWNYQSFTARSVLRTRTADITALIRLAQAYSTTTYLSEDRISTPGTDYLFGFDSVNIRVRGGKLYSYQIESTNKIFESYVNTFYSQDFSSNDAGVLGRDELSTYELDEENRYTVRYCLLGDFKDDVQEGIHNPQPLTGDDDGKLNMVCARDGSPYEMSSDLLALNTGDAKEGKVNFDIHISFERPTAEPFSAVIWFKNCTNNGCPLPEDDDDIIIIPSGDPRTFKVRSNHTTVENIYGIRVFLINRDDDDNTFRYFDVLETGLVVLQTPDG